ncbi:MAG: glycosyltransferase family 4 protein [Nitrospinae bacterium]|nr:glycosyltransferase family 4 protein [Nitrospinota bacterium]
MTKPIKILTIYYRHKPGGFCKRLKMKIEAYLDRGWTVHYVAVEPFPYNHPNLIPHILLTPMRNHDSIPFWIYFFLTAPFYMALVGIKHRVDLISVFSPLYALISAPAKWVLQVPMITLVRFPPHQNPIFSYRESCLITWVESFLEKLGLAFSDRVLATSEAVRDAVIKRYPRGRLKTAVLYNHLQEVNFDKTFRKDRLIQEFALSQNPFIVATTGILHKRKNQDCLLRAFAEAGKLESVLLIIGDGEQKEPLKQLTAELGVEERTIFTGWREDVLELIQGADLFVFGSAQEGMSNSLLEAIAADLPCLVSDVPENREVVTNPEQHFCPDQPSALAGKIVRAIEDPEYYDKLSESTLEDKKRFVFDWSGEIIKEAEQLLNRSQG